MEKTILRRQPEGYCDYEFKDYLPEEKIVIITGNTHYKSYGDKKLIDIINNDYYDDEAGYDYEPLAYLEKITNKKWECKTISGYSQGDWNELYYVVDEVTEEYIDILEAFYFGMVDEFIVEEDEEFNYHVYIPHDIVWKGKEAICNEVGLKPEDTIVLIDDGYKKVYNYKELV